MSFSCSQAESTPARPALIILLALLALTLITGAAYAMGRLTNFIPGFGFTSSAQPVIVLDAPIAQTLNGITLGAEKAVWTEGSHVLQVSDGDYVMKTPDRRPRPDLDPG